MSIISESSRSSSNESISNDRQQQNEQSQQQYQEDVQLEVKFAVNIVLNKFYLSDDLLELEFPSSLNSGERAYVHKLCKLNDLISTTKGKGSKKYVLVSKKSENQLITSEPKLNLSTDLKIQLDNLNNSLSISDKELDILIPRIQKQSSNEIYELYRSLNRLELTQARIAAKRASAPLFRDKLPVYLCHDEIINSIGSNRIVFIGGESGIGKTTQICQFILDNCVENVQKCRLLIGEPNDLIAYYSAARVAKQRGEMLGETVGYETLNETKTSENTMMHFCSYEKMLKILMNLNESSIFNCITHIILDEIHLRHKFTDFLFILIKELLVKYKFLKFILIGSSANIEFVQKYFNQCSMIIVPSFLKNTQEFFLEDILKLTEFHVSISNELKIKSTNIFLLEQWCIERRKQSYFKENAIERAKLNNKKGENELVLGENVDDLIAKAWSQGKLECLLKLLDLIEARKINVDYQHTQTLVSSLMIAVISGHLNVVEKLLRLGANVFLKSCNDLDSIEWAKRFSRNEIVELLECYSQLNLNENLMHVEFLIEKEMDFTSKISDEHSLLKAYYRELSTKTHLIDFHLISNLLSKIIKSVNHDSILIYLPSYEEINELYDLLIQNKIIQEKKFEIVKIFPEMKWSNLTELNDPQRKNLKIVLATNIAESLINIDNVSVIIDSGINREDIFDSSKNSTLKKNLWVSKMCAFNRKNKITSFTHSGVCYRLYSKHRYKNFIGHQMPQILNQPTQEVCLLAKLIVPFNTSITDLISKAPDSPAFLQLRNSINYLKTIDTLDTWEDMTEIGTHLVNMPFDLKLAKTILYSISLKCLEPILIIACSLAIGDPFKKGFSNQRVSAQIEIKEKLGGNANSDHFVLYRVFKEWQLACGENCESKFCEENFLSSSTMRKIDSLKWQLLLYLESVHLFKNEQTVNKNSNSLCFIRAALIAGAYPNIIRIDSLNNRLLTECENKVKIAFDSVIWPRILNDKVKETPPSQFEWIIFDEIVQLGNLQCVKYCTLVSSLSLALFAGCVRFNERYTRELNEQLDKHDEINFKIENWIYFKMSKQECRLILQLRQKWNLIFLKSLKSQPLNEEDEEFLDMLKNILDNHESTRSVFDYPNNLRLKLLFFKNEFSTGRKCFVSYFKFGNEENSQIVDGKKIMQCEIYFNCKKIREFLKIGKIYVLFLNETSNLSFVGELKDNCLKKSELEFSTENTRFIIELLDIKNKKINIDSTHLFDGQEIDFKIAEGLIESRL